MAVIVSIMLFKFPIPMTLLYLALPVFGFFTVGMHAGYAIYFPELFPTRIRGTGAGFCFNAGRIIAAPILILTGWLQSTMDLTQNEIGLYLSGLYLLALIVLVYAPETLETTAQECNA